MSFSADDRDAVMAAREAAAEIRAREDTQSEVVTVLRIEMGKLRSDFTGLSDKIVEFMTRTTSCVNDHEHRLRATETAALEMARIGEHERRIKALEEAELRQSTRADIIRYTIMLIIGIAGVITGFMAAVRF